MIISKKFTACNIQITKLDEKRAIVKKIKQSVNNFLNIIFFIEILIFRVYMTTIRY